MSSRNSRTYFLAMAVYWSGFGLTTMFAPRLMDLFQSAEGTAANTAFSDHVWFHGGLDIMALVVVLVALAKNPQGPEVLRAVGLAAMMPAAAITVSLLATPYWSPLFAVAALGCFSFGVWGLMLSRGDALPVTGSIQS